MVGKTTRAMLLVALSSVIVSAAFAESFNGRLRDNGDGTVTDRGTGLTWVGDRDFAVSSGFVSGVAVSRAEAAALVAAMNAGEIENFGRHNWRVPSARELASFPDGADLLRLGLERIHGPAHAAGPILARPVSGDAVVAGISDAAILAVNSIQLDKNANVVGDVVVNDASPGPTLASGLELKVDRDGLITGDVDADSVKLDQGVTVTGAVTSNGLVYNPAKTDVGAAVSPLALPVFSVLPPFESGIPRAGAADVTVADGASQTISANDYGVVTVGSGSTLVLGPGTYNLGSVTGGDSASILYTGAVKVRVAGRLAATKDLVIGPAEGSGVAAGNVIFYVAGVNGPTGTLAESPKSIDVGRGASVAGNLYAANGTIRFDRDAVVNGSLIARDVQLGQRGEVIAGNFFGNAPPVAFPQTVSTSGSGAVTIILAGEDPEGGDLGFSIVTPPTQGTLGAITPIVPSPVTDPETSETIQPPTWTASVTYTPNGPGNLADSFVFRVTDPQGATGTAQVTINPPPESTPGPPPETVVVANTTANVAQDSSSLLGMTGNAPDGVGLTFSILLGTGPSHGTLGAVTQGSEIPQRTATVLYTPDAGYLGDDSFDYQACGTIDSVLVCASATYSIVVFEQSVEPPVEATSQEVTAFTDTPLFIDLTGAVPPSLPSASEESAGVRVSLAPLSVDTGASIAGNTADADFDGFGDNHNALPGSAPGLMSAGNHLTGGAGSNGTVRMQVEWDISALGGGYDLTSAMVTLTTNRGTTDSADTSFWIGAADGDGLLSDDDFETDASQILDLSMPVPDLSEQAQGEDGTFSFDVLPYVKAALAQGFDYFVVQGRVAEQPAFNVTYRGLQVYTTASGNLGSGLEPRLLTTAFTFTILSLPTNGTLKDGNGNPITTVPTSLPSSRVSYQPSSGFTGPDSFSFQVSNGISSAIGNVGITVRVGTCQDSVLFCTDGR